MAAASILPAMSTDAEKSVHPFFKRPNGHNSEKPHIRDEIPASESSEPLISEGAPIPEIPDAKPKRTTSKRKARNEGSDGKKKVQRTLSQIANPKGLTEQNDVVDLCTSEPIDEDTPRKRRRTGEYESIEVGSEDAHFGAVEVEQSSPIRPARLSPQVIIPRSSPLPTKFASVIEPSTNGESEITSGPVLPSTPPKKLLRLNANGKFSSPLSKKPKYQGQEEDRGEPEQPRQRVRRRRSAAVTVAQELLVRLPFGSGAASRAALADKISRIMSDEDTVPLDIPHGEPSTPKRKARNQTAPKKASPKKATPTKPPHPFFNCGKPTAQPSTKRESTRKTSAVTPGKLRMQAMSEQPNDTRDAQPFGSALLKDRLMVRHPGARESPFPDREQAHVRGDLDLGEQPLNESTFDVLFPQCKRKQARLPLPPQEFILSQYARTLKPEKERVKRIDGFREPSDRLKVPERLVIPGQDITHRISRELSVSFLDESADELGFTSSQARTHPALQRIHARIPSTLTAFDESRGEALLWTQKYAPSSSADVLQPENEVAVLKDWLNSLAVQSVGGAVMPSKSAFSTKIDKPKRRRKKKPDDLDDFLVDSDEDVTEMSEIIDPTFASPVGSRKALRSMVQVAGDGMKLSNAVLLSGAHGCGKTAAAYAVAKELGFKIFEISSSERRSGKDVLDKIGDMTENHQVKHLGAEPEEPSHMDEAFQKDLQSGRQGKMSAFFKATSEPNPKTKQLEPKKVVQDKAQKAVIDALKKPAKDQQQSLILLEEVDILFKDDKEFWTTILKLIVTSKRPFIMTCNDEDLVPFQAMSLHAVLRFKQPPLDLATDYMLLVAAAEGHLLRRSAVANLYRHHDFDLRASMTELNYWCQMGVGDPREGLGWIFQRWPPGSDVDTHGRKLRVVSEGTYDRGMGLLPAHDPTTEDALAWAWTQFGVEPATALGWLPYNETVNRSDGLEAPLDAAQKRSALRRQMKLSEALSAADTCTSLGAAMANTLDATYPKMSDKARSHYTEGMSLLQTDELVDYSGQSEHLRLALILRAYTSFGDSVECCQRERVLAKIATSKSEAAGPLTRHAFSCFDAISTPAELSLMNPGLQQSVFDGPLNIIAQDLAPYVRSIVQYDQALEEQRERLNLITSEGRTAKRSRTTRAARSALEGSQRSTTRRERWFTKDLDVQAVLSTAGKIWPRAGDSAPPSLGDRPVTEGTDAPPSSVEVVSQGF